MDDALQLGTDLFGDLVRPTAQSVLARRFIFPPFSVLNAREGEWQERKRAWLLTGIRSELGRVATTGGSAMPSAGGKYDKDRRGMQHGRDLGLDGRTALVYREPKPGELEHYRDKDQVGAKPTWRTGSDLDHYRNKEEGKEPTQDVSTTSVFDPVLCELAYRWWSPLGGLVLDPFAGGSVRGIVASALGRHYVGIDLSARQIEANRSQRHLCEGPEPEWIHGDSRNVRALLHEKAFTGIASPNFLFSCPPYADLERYSDDPADLSTLSYPEFRAAYSTIIKECAALLEQDSFACFVVGDVRGRDGNYYGLPTDTVLAFEDAGMRLYNEAILITSVGSLPVRINSQFNKARKLGKTHQNVLVFVKGDAKRAAAKCERLDANQTGTEQEE